VFLNVATRLNIVSQHLVCAARRLTEGGWRKKMDEFDLVAGLRVRQDASACRECYGRR
jgi:hypothetical protein